MAIAITTGDDKEILDSGTVITYLDEPLIFQVASDLKIILSFKSNPETKDHKMDFSIPNDNSLEINLTNFNNSLGTGNAAPLKVAKLNGRQLYLNFVVYAMGETSSKSVNYTWYLREAENG